MQAETAQQIDSEIVPEAVRLVVRSIGTASFAIVSALRQITTLSEQELAERLFRAPAELFSGVPRASAEKAAEILRGAGLDVDVLPLGAVFASGDRDHDVALVPGDYTQMSDVLKEVMRFLGVDAKTGRRILCSSPTILVGGVSAATVAALRQRFEPLGVQLAVSRPSATTFDLIVCNCVPSIRSRLIETLRAAGAPMAEGGAQAADTSLVATDLDRATAEQIWDRFGRKNPSLRILDRAFERFDIRLDACPRTAIPELIAITGMPEKIALKVLERLPVIVQQGLTFEEARQSISRLLLVGAKAVDELATLQTFSMAITAIHDRARTAQVIRALLDLKEDAADALLRALPARIEGPLSLPHARWLQAELKAAGATAKLIRQ